MPPRLAIGTDFRLRQFFIILPAALILIIAALFAPAEFGALGAESRSFDSFLSVVDADDSTPAAISLSGQVGQLEGCDDALASINALLAPSETRESVAKVCLTLAEAILAQSPTMSVAHLVKASANTLMMNGSEASLALQASRAFAPNEGWLAARRLRTAFRGLQLGLDVMSPAVEEDTKTVLASNRYYSVLVDFYFSQPDKREWLTATLAEEDGRLQRRLLNAIRARTAPQVTQ